MHPTTQKTLGALVALALLTGCGPNSSNAGSEYIGKWENVRFISIGLEIERNGENFIVRNKRLSFVSGKQEPDEIIPMTYKDGLLQHSAGFTVAIDKASGNITDGRGEYKRVSEFTKLR
jgi:hypothetical protein